MSADDGVIYAIASVTLSYPTPEVAAGRADLVDLARSLGRSKANDGLRSFLDWWARLDPRALEQEYVKTFDLHKRCTLYLSYYLYGDRRQRGGEFVKLKHRYEAVGLRLAGRELPDYLPLMLEFAATEPEAGAAALADFRVGLELLGAALHDAGSPWASLVDAVGSSLPKLDAAGRDLVRRLAAEGPPGEQVGLEPYGPAEAMPEAVGGPAVDAPSWADRR